MKETQEDRERERRGVLNPVIHWPPYTPFPAWEQERKNDFKPKYGCVNECRFASWDIDGFGLTVHLAQSTSHVIKRTSLV